MCMFDLKAGRQAEAVLILDAEPVNGQLIRVAPADPNRMTLILSAQFETAATTADFVVVRTGGRTGGAVAVLSPQNPTVMLHVAQVGQVATAETWASGQGTVGIGLNVTGVRFNLPLEQLG